MVNKSGIRELSLGAYSIGSHSWCGGWKTAVCVGSCMSPHSWCGGWKTAVCVGRPESFPEPRFSSHQDRFAFLPHGRATWLRSAGDEQASSPYMAGMVESLS